MKMGEIKLKSSLNSLGFNHSGFVEKLKLTINSKRALAESKGDTGAKANHMSFFIV